MERNFKNLSILLPFIDAATPAPAKLAVPAKEKSVGDTPKQVLGDLLSYLSPVGRSFRRRHHHRQSQLQNEITASPENQDAIAAAAAAVGTEEPAAATEVKNPLDAYTTVKTLGQGAFGEVSLATHNLTQHQKRRIDQTGSGTPRALREIMVHKMLRHPHICHLLEVIDDTDNIYLVLEYCSRGELFDAIVREKKLSEDKAREYFSQLVDAVRYCHDRDLKPENLLLDADGRLKVIDFGLTNIYTDNQLLQTACGSPAYAAPEMISQKPYRGPEVDIWALGVNLFTFVCGFSPFDDERLARVYSNIMMARYTFPEHVSADLRDLIGRMLKVDPQSRPSFNDILAHPWMIESRVVDEDAVRALVDLGTDETDLRFALEDEEPSALYASYTLMSWHLASKRNSERDRNKPRLVPMNDQAALDRALTVLKKAPASTTGDKTDVDVIAAALAKLK